MRPHRLPLLALTPLLVLVPACETIVPPPPDELDLWNDAAAGVQNEQLAKLCANVWDASLAYEPFEATFKGDPRFLADIPRRSQRAREARRQELADFRLRAGAIDVAELSVEDRLTHELLIQAVEGDSELIAIGLDDWVVDPLAGPHIQILNLTSVQPTETQRERKLLVERWESLSTFIRQAGTNLKVGKARGKVASRTSIEKCIGQLNEILETDPMESPLVTIATGGGRWVELSPGGSVSEIAHRELGDARRQRDLRTLNRHLQDGARLSTGTRLMLPGADDSLSIAERGEFLHEVLAAVENKIYPALAGYRELLQSEILPGARPDDQPGLSYLPGGLEDYATLVHEHTSLPRAECDPRGIHEFGLQEVRRIRSEIAELGLTVFGTSDVGVIQERLRNDPAMHFASREEVEAKASEALFNARAKMDEYFGILPQTDCEVVRIPAHEEKNTTIAYYRAPSADGARPGRYFINTFEPETRPRYEAEVLAYHEAIPGHHLQIAIAQERDNLPLFRRHAETTAFVEGWALYTERLCDEMGLYSGDVDRLGVLSFDAWRACRLVVDTGIHAMGWSRDQAIEYLYDNTLLARNNVENEVDRYIAWPGQALAYKIGQRELLALRDRAQEVRGNAFSYPEFHDRVLENGAISLASLRGVIERWLGS